MEQYAADLLKLLANTTKVSELDLNAHRMKSIKMEVIEELGGRSVG